MLAILILSLLSLGVSLFSLRVAMGAARVAERKQEPPQPEPPRYIGDMYRRKEST